MVLMLASFLEVASFSTNLAFLSVGGDFMANEEWAMEDVCVVGAAGLNIINVFSSLNFVYKPLILILWKTYVFFMSINASKIPRLEIAVDSSWLGNDTGGWT